MANAGPVLVRGLDAEGERLSLLPSQHKTFDEKWLQELLYKHPSILPVDEIDEAFSPPISIGREIANIDNLFVSPHGLLTVVETKLWRNPEAHRTVVAQILDYASTLTTWDYQRLDKDVQADMQRRTGQSKSIYRAVSGHRKGLDFSEIEFQQKVQECLTEGRFALLIVGDKILPGATQLAEIIQSAPHLQFSIGFVELQCYRLNRDADWPLVVCPRFLAKTREVTRAIVKVLYEEKKPDIEVFTPREEITPSGRTSLPQFIASLPTSIADIFKAQIEDWMRKGHIFYWGTTGFSVRMVWKGNKRTLLDAYPTMVSVLQEKYVKEFDLPKEAYDKYKAELMTSPTIGSLFASRRRYVNYDSISKEEFLLLLNATDKLLNALSTSKNAAG